MNSLQRNLWVLVTVSALAIILQNTFNRVNVTSDISQRAHSCQKVEQKKCKKKKKKCTTTYTSCSESYVRLEKKKSCSHSYSYSYSYTTDFPDIDDWVSVDKLPAATNFAAVAAGVAYPTYAREKGIEGKVVARVLVDQNGNYVKHKIMDYDNCGMRYNVEKQLPKLKFEAGEKSGEKVAVWVNIPFEFTLN
jgi:hypothetical protein